jgi:UDP-glucose 4-epimerase
MKVLLTGGAGFIGSHVADALLAAGHEVVIVDDLSSGSLANIPSRARFYLVNICSAELEKVFQIEKPDIVDHHAAQISVTVSARDPLRDARINALGLLNVLECCRASKVGKLIFISSGGAIYGEAGVDRIPEDYPAVPLSPYAIHKQLGESYLRFYAATYGLSSTTLRYANVYGPRQNPDGEAGVVAIFASKLLRGEVPVINAYPEDPDGMSRDYVYVEDVARANLLALDRAEGEAVNIATSRPVKTLELLATISRLMGRPLAYTRGEARPGDLRRSCLDNAKAARVLGWKPSHDLEAGLEKTVAFFGSHA